MDAVSSTPSIGSFFGSSPAKVTPSPAPKLVPQPDINAKMQQLAEERKAAAEARKIEAEEKREAALKAAEAKKQEAAEKRALLEANRKQEAEERRQAALEAAEDRKRGIAERAAAQEAVRKEQASKAAEAAEARKRGIVERAAAQEAARKKQAAKAAVAIAKAKPGGTISLGFLNFGQSDKDESDEPTIVSSAPRGVPTLSKWKKNFDGSITGFISGEYISMFSRYDY